MAFFSSLLGGPSIDLPSAVGEAVAKLSAVTGGGDDTMKNVEKNTMMGLFSPSLSLMGVYNTSTSRDSDETFVNSRVAKEFGDVDSLSDWARDLDDSIAVGCNEVVKELKAEKRSSGRNLSWEDVLCIFRRSNYVNKSNEKNIDGQKSWNEMNYFKFDGSPDEVRRRQIMTWLRTLFNEQNEQDIVDNSIVFNNGLIRELADIVSQSGATVRDTATLFAADEDERKRVREVGVIRFPTKGKSRIKVYHIAIYGWFKCSRVLFAQNDSSGIDVTCKVCEFKINTSAVDSRHASKARDNLAKEENWDF